MPPSTRQGVAGRDVAGRGMTAWQGVAWRGMVCVILVSFSLAGSFFPPQAHLILIVLPEHFVSCMAGPWRPCDTEDHVTREPCQRGDLAGQVLKTWIPFPMENHAGPGLLSPCGRPSCPVALPTHPSGDRSPWGVILELLVPRAPNPEAGRRARGTERRGVHRYTLQNRGALGLAG